MYRLLYLFFVLFSILLFYIFKMKSNNYTNQIKNRTKLMLNQIRENKSENCPISELIKKEWDYKENGMDWPEFSYMVSPIDIDSKSTIKKSKKSLTFHYPKEIIKMFGNNNGNMLYFSNENHLYFCEYKEEFFRFQELNYHHSSEHSIDSIAFDAELQFIHRSLNNNILIASVFVDYKENSDPDFYNQYFGDTFSNIPNFKNKKNITYKGDNKNFDLHDLFCQKLSTSTCFVYTGDLTVPSLGEKQVTWIIFKQPMYVPYKLSNIDGLVNNSVEVKKNLNIPILELNNN